MKIFQKLFLLFITLYMCSLPAQEKIRLFLTDGKILTTKDISIEKNGDISFYSKEAKQYVLLPKHLLKKMQYPKPEELKTADTLFQKKKYKESALLYEKSIKSVKNIPEWEYYALYKSANSFLLAGDRKNALQILEKSFTKKDIPLTDKTPEAYYNILLLFAHLHAGEKEFSKAYPFLEKLISSPKETFASQGLFLKGELLFKEEKWEKAFHSFYLYTILFPRLPETAEARKFCGKALEKLKDPRAVKFQKK